MNDASLGEGGILPEGDPSEVPYSPLFRYPWKRVAEALEAMPAAPTARSASATPTRSTAGR